jgi:putative drug exporter of the RND superfamily
MLVPSPAFRSMALGIMLSVVFVLAATLTLLPAVLAKLGPKVDSVALRCVHSGAVMVAVFFTFALLGPLPPKEISRQGSVVSQALLALPFGLAIGLLLGSVGGGGSILAVPVLV